MEQMHSRDKNLIFKYSREKLIAPQPKANLYIPYIEGTKQNWERVPITTGTDQNTFFRVNKTPQPILRTRIFKGIPDPLSSTIGQLPKTTKERQSLQIVGSIEGILKSLRTFMSTQEVDALGNVVLDPLTNRPVIVVRNIEDILRIAHTAIADIFAAAGVIPNPNQLVIINSFTVNSSVIVAEQLRDLEKIQPDRAQAEREQLYVDAIIKERLRLDDQILPATPVVAALTEAIEEQKIDDDWNNHAEYTQQHFSPNMWRDASIMQRADLKQFIATREETQATNFFTEQGTVIGVPARGLTMGRQFAAGHYIDLDGVEFVALAQVPGGERDA